MIKIKVGDTIRDKKTGVIGTVMNDSPSMGMYYVAIGECREWISYENAEKAVMINKDAIQNDNRMLSSYGLDIKSLQNRIKELEEENARLKKENSRMLFGIG